MPIRRIRSTKRRRLAALSGLGVLLLALVLSACGSDSDSGTGSSSSASTGASEEKSGSDIDLALLTASTTQNVFQEITWGGEAAGQKEGVNLSTQAPNGVNPPAELTMFQASTQTSKDGIVLDTTAPELFIRPLKTATEEGIPLVAADAAPPEGSGVETFVGNSNVKVGEVVGEELLKSIPEDETGEVVFGNDIPGLSLLEQRIEGMEAVLEKERPGLKMVGPFNVGSEPAENYNNWNNVVKAHPDAVAYLAPGDQDGVSLAKIEQATGNQYLVGACDVDPIALEALKKGLIQVLGDPYHYLKGYIAVSLLAQQAKTGEDMPEGWWDPGQGIVTKANIDEIIQRESSNEARNEFFEPIAEEELANPDKYIQPLSAFE
jgi:ABC-type sugar transport system substrate-binding protein